MHALTEEEIFVLFRAARKKEVPKQEKMGTTAVRGDIECHREVALEAFVEDPMDDPDSATGRSGKIVYFFKICLEILSGEPRSIW